MKQYRIEIYQYHVKVDEFEADTKKEIESWFKKHYKLAEEYGECCHYLFNNGKDVNKLREEQREAMTAELSKRDFTPEENAAITEMVIDAAYNWVLRPRVIYRDGGPCFEPGGDELKVRFDSDTVLGKKILRAVQQRMGYPL